jgi:hypothetical protein
VISSIIYFYLSDENEKGSDSEELKIEELLKDDFK